MLQKTKNDISEMKEYEYIHNLKFEVQQEAAGTSPHQTGQSTQLLSDGLDDTLSDSKDQFKMDQYKLDQQPSE